MDFTTEEPTGANDVSQPGGKPEEMEWLTVREAAAYAGRVGVSTVRQACNRKELRHVRVGGRSTGPIRTRKEWVDEWLEAWARGGPLV